MWDTPVSSYFILPVSETPTVDRSKLEALLGSLWVWWEPPQLEPAPEPEPAPTPPPPIGYVPLQAGKGAQCEPCSILDLPVAFHLASTSGPRQYPGYHHPLADQRRQNPEDHRL